MTYEGTTDFQALTGINVNPEQVRCLNRLCGFLSKSVPTYCVGSRTPANYGGILEEMIETEVQRRIFRHYNEKKQMIGPVFPHPKNCLLEACLSRIN
ncbi:hypothetical protein J4463_03385 [Candidatus Pacearchaeota archaeon]|nr:hypothetical protein [Candidatus Pacearchaeota archaeon]